LLRFATKNWRENPFIFSEEFCMSFFQLISISLPLSIKYKIINGIFKDWRENPPIPIFFIWRFVFNRVTDFNQFNKESFTLQNHRHENF